jgi:ankyrin repeat protein
MLAMTDDKVTLAEFLFARGANVNAVDGEGLSVLQQVTRNARSSMEAWLLAHGACPNPSDEKGTTPLFNATRKGSPLAVRALLEHGARNERTWRHHAPIFEVFTARDRHAVLDAYLAHAALLDWSVTNDRGDTPLHAAVRADCASRNDEFTEAFARANLLHDKPCLFGANTPLDLARRLKGSEAVVRVLTNVLVRTSAHLECF